MRRARSQRFRTSWRPQINPTQKTRGRAEVRTTELRTSIRWKWDSGKSRLEVRQWPKAAVWNRE